MIIILSPSKTKKIRGQANNEPNKDIVAKIVKKVASLSEEEISKKMKIKLEKAKDVLAFFKNYESMPTGASILSYTGQVFKAFGIKEDDYDYVSEHVYILSCLYGILKPFDGIKEYRLDFDNKIIDLNTWKSVVNDTLNGKEVLNLASKEYTKQIDVPMVEVVFTTKIQIKKARGLLLRQIVDNRIQSIEDLKILKSFVKEEDGKMYFEV